MHHVAPSPKVEVFGLLDSLDREWIKLPLAVMRDAGPAVQTLGGFLRVTDRETYSPISAIAQRARLPLKTARNHLVTLAERGWLTNAGRERTRRGAPRRTCTLRLTKKAKESFTDAAGDFSYAVLPWWSCCHVRNASKLSWSAKVVLSIVMARLMALKAEADRQDLNEDEESLAVAIEEFGGDDRFKFSLDRLQALTGLSRHSIIEGKHALKKFGIIELVGGNGPMGTEKDSLAPNYAFRIKITPTADERCFIDFGRGCNSGQ